eukprot:TRINITY_DN12124_c0_g1_i1.p1 TRINITY_DN12124_c0_g1~~TRINITY_DN12124_c0_g1_i1.p1  ORF type:complete len:114 (+),score=27.32 TRINITY_DN12124_c0_g1_i1:91-432(+)
MCIRDRWLSVASAANGLSPLAPLVVVPYNAEATSDRHLQAVALSGAEGSVLEDVAGPTLLMLRSQELLEKDGTSRLASHRKSSEALLELDSRLKSIISSFVRADVEQLSLIHI